jgi:hypothetical protein
MPVYRKCAFSKTFLATDIPMTFKQWWAQSARQTQRNVTAVDRRRVPEPTPFQAKTKWLPVLAKDDDGPNAADGPLILKTSQ